VVDYQGRYEASAVSLPQEVSGRAVSSLHNLLIRGFKCAQKFNILLKVLTRVPELVERQLFARAGAEVVFCPAPDPGMKNLIKCYKNLKFFIPKFEVDFKKSQFRYYLLKRTL
jgi:hypothetical protein